MRPFAFFFMVAFSLAACASGFKVTNVEGDPPQYAYNSLLAYAIAQEIAKGCNGSLSFNETAWQQRYQEITAQLRSDGFIEAGAQGVAFPGASKKLVPDTVVYLEKNSIDYGRPTTFCAAGNSEISNGSEIGQYLRKTS